MRICYVIQRFDPYLGGEQRDAFDSARGLVELGHELTILTQSSPFQSGETPFSIIPLGACVGSRQERKASFLPCG